MNESSSAERALLPEQIEGKDSESDHSRTEKREDGGNLDGQDRAPELLLRVELCERAFEEIV